MEDYLNGVEASEMENSLYKDELNEIKKAYRAERESKDAFFEKKSER